MTPGDKPGEEHLPPAGEATSEGALGRTGGAPDLRDRGAPEPLRPEQPGRRALEPILRADRAVMPGTQPGEAAPRCRADHSWNGGSSPISVTGAMGRRAGPRPAQGIGYRRVTPGRQHEDTGRAGVPEPVAALDVRVLGPIAEADAV
ncbi:hypothetical protein GCM10010358_58840 [Streptomyces minutiscleroticus]|uniref:Uncharacterized protein n=1 Tax=Streptomyces minutiscleroticus TaxID=68238 RepID=A0A918U6C2_9ACTN|nr:hypothetical protein [Streptomyces minutiscleroticus]GGX97254.1 hypothetical protein GCM10010358_58840 [Streptomyces minutiscleroticus]